MSGSDLPTLLERGAGPPLAGPEVTELWERGRRRRRSKRLAGAAGGGLAAIVAVVAVTLALDLMPLEGPEIHSVQRPVPAEPIDVTLPDEPTALDGLTEATGATVVGVTGHRMTFVDVDARDVTTRELPELSPGDPPHFLLAGDRLVFYGSAELYAMDIDPDARPEPIVETDSFAVFVPAGVTDRLWVRPGRTDRSPAEVFQVDMNGKVLRGPAQSPGGNLAVGLRDSVVLQQDDRLVVWDPEQDRVLTEVEGPFPMGSDGERFAWCDHDCRQLHLTHPNTEQTWQVAELPEQVSFGAYAGKLSPTGRYLAAPICEGEAGDQRRGQDLHCALEVFDLEAGQARTVAHGHVSSHTSLAWGPGEGWLFALLDDDRIAAYQPGTPEAHVIDLEEADLDIHQIDVVPTTQDKDR